LSGPRRVAINEIAWCGTPASPDDEWIELVNLTGEPMDLAGWTIRWLTSSSGDWVSIPLSGRISGLPYASSLGGDTRHVTFLPSDEDGLWRVLYLAWWGVEASTGVGQGFYVIERGDDDTVGGVPAGLIYDEGNSRDFALPDQGTMVELIDATGVVVDRIDAVAGWPAGGGVAAASMERLHLQQSGSIVEWNSSPGVFRSGMDRAGRALAATAGLPNSPSLDALMERAVSRVGFVEVSGPASVTIPADDRSDRPRIHLSVAAGELAIGGGGSADATPQVWQRWRSDEGLTLGFDHLPAGRFFVWIVDSNGLRLLPIAAGD